MALRNRVTKLVQMEASDLLDHEHNWRRHPRAQEEALAEVLAEVGFAGAVLAYRNEAGEPVVIDGHLRANMLKGETVPVLMTDLTEAEADAVLLSHDGIAHMAVVDQSAYSGLLEQVAESYEALAEMMQDAVVQDLVPEPWDDEDDSQADPTAPTHQCPACGHEW